MSDADGTVDTPNVTCLDVSLKTLPWAENEWAKAIEEQVAEARAEARIATERYGELKDWVTLLSCREDRLAPFTLSSSTADGSPLTTALLALKKTIEVNVVERVGEITAQLVDALSDDVAASIRAMSKCNADLNTSIATKFEQVNNKCRSLKKHLVAQQAEIATLTAELSKVSKLSQTASRPLAIALMESSTKSSRRRYAWSAWSSFVRLKRISRAALARSQMLAFRTHQTKLRDFFTKWRIASHRAPALAPQPSEAARFASALLCRDIKRTLCLAAWSRWSRFRADRVRQRVQLATVRGLLTKFVGDTRRRTFTAWRHETERRRLAKAHAATLQLVRMQELKSVARVLQSTTSTACRRHYFAAWLRRTRIAREHRLKRKTAATLFQSIQTHSVRRAWLVWRSLVDDRHRQKTRAMIGHSQDALKKMEHLVSALRRGQQEEKLKTLVRRLFVDEGVGSFERWLRYTKLQKALRARQANALALNVRSNSSTIRRFYQRWRLWTTGRREAFRHGRVAIKLLLGRQTAALRSAAFTKWIAWCRTSRTSLNAYHMSLTRRCMSRWLQMHRQASLRNNRYRRREVILRKGLITLMHTASTRTLVRRIFLGWYRYHQRDTKFRAMALRYQAHSSHVKKAALFSAWKRKIPAGSFCKPSVIDDLATAVAHLESETSAARQHLTTLTLTLDRRRHTPDTSALHELERSLAAQGLAVDSKSFEKAIRLMGELRRKQAINRSKRSGPKFSSDGKSQYCECCFDKQPDGVSVFHRQDAICRQRFDLVSEAIGALCQWIAHVDAKTTSALSVL